MSGQAAAHRILDAEGVTDFIAGLAGVRARLGGDPGRWRVSEVGDGNLNLVFLVDGPNGSVCVKQALPYVRVAGPGWPMSPQRAFFENAYFAAVAPHVGGLIPRIEHYDPALHCTVMERLSPHRVLRHSLIEGRRLPAAARDIGEFVARTCFFTSDLALPVEAKLDALALFAGNKPLIRISVDLIFTEPYQLAARNRHTSPQLDRLAAALRSDAALKARAAWFGHKFLTHTQALLHGDLHSGSVMATATDTRVIDPEFAFYGPIGFDLGAFLANLLLSWYSQPGLETVPGERAAHQAWILEQVGMFWTSFRSRFLALWAEAPRGAAVHGDAYPRALFDDAAGRAALDAARGAFLDELFRDMLGFAACKMIRRIVGFAHVADFERIADPDRRAHCETGALALAAMLLRRPDQFGSIRDLVDAVPRSPSQFSVLDMSV